jgi:TolA-binding protein
MAIRAAVLLLAVLSCEGVRVQTSANPIRKVVNLLQNLQAKVTAEGEKETELFEKFQCYCKNGVGTLETSIADAETKITELEASIKSQTAEKKQLDEDLKQAKADRSAAKEAVAEATAIRKKEAAAFAKDNADSTTNLAAWRRQLPQLRREVARVFCRPPRPQQFGTSSST